MPRKKPKQELSDRGEQSPIDLANLWTSWKIYDKILGRIPHEGKERCEDCGAKPRTLHIIPCKLEPSPCGIHETCWECDCEYYKED